MLQLKLATTETILVILVPVKFSHGNSLMNVLCLARIGNFLCEDKAVNISGFAQRT